MATLFPSEYATGGWVTSTTASTWTTTGTTDVWLQWMAPNSTSSSTTYGVVWQTQGPVWDAWCGDEEERARRHDELQARREQVSRERLAAQQRRYEDKQMADARARELLHGLLSDDERAVMAESQRLVIEGSDGRLYHLEMHRDTVHGNIVRVDEHGCMLGRACVAPRMYDDFGSRVLPTEDGWVGQYLGLKFDTEEFLSHANWSGTRPCAVRQQEAA